MPEQTLAVEATMTINNHLARRVMDALGENVYLCYQCVKCTSGCPLAEFFDWQPNQILRALQLGQEDIALEALTPWLCASCQTCATRCPQGIDITAIMEFLTREALARGLEPSAPEVNIFNEAFLREVRLWGRAYEPGLMVEMKLRTLNSGHLFDDLELYVKMLQKRKVAFLPSPARGRRRAKPVAGAATSIAYYPGCSLHSGAREFNDSALAVAQALGMELIEPKGWVCCGSSAAHRADPETALRLPLENLALIEQSGFREVTMPCAACFNRHKAAQFELRHDGDHASAVMAEAPAIRYQDTVEVTSLTQAILRHIGVAEIARRVKQPLTGLRIACYYGCLWTRPPEVTEAAHPENPTDMDELLAALGATMVDWSYKTSCCGAAHSATRPDIVHKLSGDLVRHAQAAGADLIAVACPLCHMNFDARQFQMDLAASMPVLYFTQLLALALGLPESALAVDKNLVDPRPLLRSKGLNVPGPRGESP